MILPQPPILVISDRHQVRHSLEHVAKAVFAAGGRWLLVREKDLEAAARLALVRRVLDIAQPFGATVMISADVAAVTATGAAGVHMPDGGDVAAARVALGAGALIGFSAHDEPDAAAATAAVDAGADYVTLSPIFPSISKPGYGPALGLAAIREASARVPVLALGGVTHETVAECLDAGATGVAVMGAVMGAADPGAAMAALVAKAVALAGQKR